MPRQSLCAARKAIAAFVFLATFAGPPVSAQTSADGIQLKLQTCTGINCNATSLQPVINGLSALANPWVGSFNLGAQQCLRVNVVQQPSDLAITVIAPNGTFFTNDDRGGSNCPSCPRAVVRTVVPGHYTVVVGDFAGVAREGLFMMNIGRYDNRNNNPNCSPQTLPSSTAAVSRAK